MDFRELEMFVAVAENSSFTLAGQQLHVAQSAVSRKIKLLEEELGEQLFNRVNKRVYLTPAGDIMLRYARKVFQDLRNARLEVSELTKMNRGTLRIGAGMTACMYLLPPIPEKFRALYPNIETQVVTGATDSLLGQIRSHEIDLGVLTLPVNSPDLEVIPFSTEELVVVASPNHPVLGKRRSLRAAEIADYPLILFNRGAATRLIIDRFFQEMQIRPHIAMESESVATIKPLVQINLGISILPFRAIATDARRKEVVYLRLRDYRLSRDIGLVLHRADYRPRALTRLTELCQSLS